MRATLIIALLFSFIAIAHCVAWLVQGRICRALLRGDEIFSAGAMPKLSFRWK